MKKNKALRKSDILYHIIKGWRIILLFTLIGIIVGVALIAVSYIRGEVAREYKVTSSIAVVGNRYPDVDITKLAPDQVFMKNDVTMARLMTDTAMYLVKSRKNMDAVAEKLNLRGVTANDISHNLTLSRVGETEVIELTLLWRSEKEGLMIMDAIDEVSSTTLKKSLKIGEISVVNESQAAFIVGGNISISTLEYSAVFGLVLGFAICILKFLIAPTLINESDVTSIFGIDTLGSLPLDQEYARLKPRQKRELPIFDDIKSVTHLLISHMEGARAKKLYITSTIHSEGKTRLLADIGLHLARLGKKTLLIDCDLVNPRLGALFFDDLKYEQTLNSLYRGDSDKLDAILHINGCLDILPTVLERNPEDINDALLNVLKTVMDGYDYVLIDAAPIGVDAEVLRLNEITDTVLYVVRYDDAKLDDIKRSMLRIAKSGIPVVGAVFNCVVNWRQTLINAPKRLSSMISREEKKRRKEEEKQASYREKMKKKEELERRPDRRYLDGIAPREPQSGNSEKKDAPKPAEKTDATQKTDLTAGADTAIPTKAEKPSNRKSTEKSPAEDRKKPAVKKSKSQKIAEKKAAEKLAKEQEATAKKERNKKAKKKK